MTILSKIINFFKAVLPVLRKGAKDAFVMLPVNDQNSLIVVSQLLEIIKQTKGKSPDEAVFYIINNVGITREQATAWMIEYWNAKGVTVSGLSEGLIKFWQEMDSRNGVGFKELFSGAMSIISNIVTSIDWEVIAGGIAQYVFETYVKDKLKI